MDMPKYFFLKFILIFVSSLYSSLAQQQTAAAALSAHHPFGVQPPHPYQQVCLFTYFFFAKSNELKKFVKWISHSK